MEEDVRNAVFGNVGTTVAFRVGPFDAEVLETIFTPRFLAADLVNLGAYQIYLTLMIDGIGSQPFSAVTLPEIPPPRISCRDMVVAASRQNFTTPRPVVEKIITDLHTPVEPPPKPPKPDTPKTDSPKVEVKPASTTSSTAPKTDKPAVTTTSRTDRPAPKPKPTSRGADRPASDRPKPAPTSSPAVTADGLKAVLARIAASTNETSSKKGEEKPTTAAPRAESAVPATDHRSALRSVLGSVLETAPAPQAAAPTPAEKPEPKPQPTVPAPAAPDSAYVPDATEPDIKVLKKILGNDAKVKSPFAS
jgi:hypothetical protein